MKNSIFEPSMLFATREQWCDEEGRDTFLKHLIDNVVTFDDNFTTSLYWTDALEMCLWAAPQLSPWRVDRDFNLPLVQIFYRRFQPKCKVLNCENDERATANPSLE